MASMKMMLMAAVALFPQGGVAEGQTRLLAGPREDKDVRDRAKRLRLKRAKTLAEKRAERKRMNHNGEYYKYRTGDIETGGACRATPLCVRLVDEEKCKDEWGEGRCDEWEARRDKCLKRQSECEQRRKEQQKDRDELRDKMIEMNNKGDRGIAATITDQQSTHRGRKAAVACERAGLKVDINNVPWWSSGDKVPGRRTFKWTGAWTDGELVKTDDGGIYEAEWWNVSKPSEDNVTNGADGKKWKCICKWWSEGEAFCPGAEVLFPVAAAPEVPDGSSGAS